MPHLQGLASYPCLFCFFVGFGVALPHVRKGYLAPTLLNRSQETCADLIFVIFVLMGLIAQRERSARQMWEDNPASEYAGHPSQHTNKRSSTAITQSHNPVVFKRHRLTIKRCRRDLQPPWKQFVCHRWRTLFWEQPSVFRSEKLSYEHGCRAWCTFAARGPSVLSQRNSHYCWTPAFRDTSNFRREPDQVAEFGFHFFVKNTCFRRAQRFSLSQKILEAEQRAKTCKFWPILSVFPHLYACFFAPSRWKMKRLLTSKEENISRAEQSVTSDCQ